MGELLYADSFINNSILKTNILDLLHHKKFLRIEINRNIIDQPVKIVDNHVFTLVMMDTKYYHIDSYIDRRELTIIELSTDTMNKYIDNLLDYLSNPSSEKWSVLFNVNLHPNCDQLHRITPPIKPFLRICGSSDLGFISEQNIYLKLIAEIKDALNNKLNNKINLYELLKDKLVEDCNS